MSLTASMWTSVSGLINHGEKMNVIGNNIANINTVGFKGQRMDFMDFVYQDTGSASGFSQVGRGVSIGAIYGDFGQGALETSTEVTDMAISGKGYFQVMPKGSENAYYTRAGNFRFDKDGYLTDPHGYVLQGWEIPETSTDSAFVDPDAPLSNNAFKGAGIVKNVQLDNFSVAPKHTNSVVFDVQLDKRQVGKSVSNNSGSTAVIDFNGPVKVDYDNSGVAQTVTLNGKSYPVTAQVGNPVISEVTATIDGQAVAVNLGAGITTIPRAAGTGTSPIAAKVVDLSGSFTGDFTYDNAGALVGSPTITMGGATFTVTGTVVSGGNITGITVTNPQLSAPATLNLTTPIAHGGGGTSPDPVIVSSGTGTLPADPAATVAYNAAGVAQTVVLNGVTYPVTAQGGTDPNITSVTATIFGKSVVLPLTTKINMPGGPGAQTINGTATIPTTNDTPFFALFNKWDAQNLPAMPPIADSAYAYSTNLKVYDEGGTAHTITVYFDKVEAGEMNNGKSTSEYWEYVVTMNPDEDKREFGGVPVAGTKNAGLLMAGTMTFDKNGQMTDTTAFAPSSDMLTASMNDLNLWKPAELSPNGLPLFAANFSGRDGLSYVDKTNPAMMQYATELNFGLKNMSGSWSGLTPTSSAADIGINANNLISMDSALNPAKRSSSASTGYGTANSTVLQKQDGYSYGFLSGVTVSSEGVLSGRYSNGVLKELYQITVYDFVSQHELRREGGNLFTQTRESGDPNPGTANNNGMGAVKSNSLEQSNVDLSREFTQMITTQRGFQANSKGITTVDTMLEVVINMKR